MSDIKTTYNGVEITYDEGRDRWVYTLNGRERSAESLTKAKAAVHRPPAKAEQKRWEAFDAFYAPWYDRTLRPVRVTSVAQKTGWQKNEQVWIVNNGRREKVDSTLLFAVTDANRQRINEIREKIAAEEALSKEINRLRNALEPISIPKEND
jgi:hypothetical protein